MKILLTDQIRELDTYTIREEPVRSIDLMERAANAFTDWFMLMYKPSRPVKIFCGTGNNGGDGLAIGRILANAQYPVTVYGVRYSEHISEDCKDNEKRLKKYLELQKIRSEKDIPIIQEGDLVIDALFGSGLSRAVEGLAAAMIETINQSGATVISVDIPSGLYADRPSVGGQIVKADHTVSFELPKLAFMAPENDGFVGSWHVVPIGLHPKGMEESEARYFLTDAVKAQNLLRKRPKFAHKGNFGHLLMMAGSHGKMGAAVLATKAALRAGVGLITTQVPRSGYQIMQATLPEAMCLVDHSEDTLSEMPDLTPFDIVAVGPGIGQKPETLKLMHALTERATQPMVIDADGLNLLAQEKGLLEKLPPNSILTPHPGEFARLCGPTENHFARLQALREFSERYGIITILKGAHTAVALPDGQIHFNTTGNPGMATAGSGDVLTGIIGGLLAQQWISPRSAAILGVYLHGLSADLAAPSLGEYSLNASDIIKHLGPAFLHIEHKKGSLKR